MARKPREEVTDGVFHVYARGNNKADIYLDDGDREAYVALLASVVGRCGWLCLAYCLMPNHLHLLIQTPRPNLGRGMQRLHGDYAQTFNVRHDRVGHLFQGRYGAVRVTDDEQLATTVGYIATNPVRAGLVKRPGAWPWGSHRALVGDDAAPAWLAADRLSELFVGAFGAMTYAKLVADRLSPPPA
jgi:REP-associated tyrosine transposase